jgi:hypothetical protein
MSFFKGISNNFLGIRDMFKSCWIASIQARVTKIPNFVVLNIQLKLSYLPLFNDNSSLR